MKLISDLHIHSRYSRACSKDLSIKTLEKYAKIKGVNILGTSDFAHPEWIKELKSELTEDETGVLKTSSGFPFILSNELSLMYTDLGKGRKVHNVILAPNFDVVDQITDELKKRGRIDYDGRPIFKIPCPEFVEMLHSISKDIEVIPAHIWTPHFGMFGSSSGFDSLKDAFQEKTKSIHAIETGLSSDPAMNWRIKELDKISLLSFSDSHSYWPWRLGRESTIFDFKNIKDAIEPKDQNEAITKLTYKDILKAIRIRKGLHGTVEVDPGYGKYHVDGHRNCNISMEPSETLKHKGICPKCNKPLTIGVLYRVEQLADKDRPENYKPNPRKQENVKDFKTLIPLSDILSAILGRAVATKTVTEEYYRIIKDTNEYHILLTASKKELLKRTNGNDKITNAILKNREGKLKVTPGYDGMYGQLVLT
jgi:uncharacterized protein (TIGR00375 family)